MTSSRKERKTRSVFDVHGGGTVAPGRRPLKDRLYGRNVLNLKPGFGRRHPWLAAVVLLVLATGVYLGVRKLTTRAEVADFYPLTCLGSWQDPLNAQGTPESLAVPGTAITAADAAIYDPAVEPLSQIYCGAFVPPDYNTEGDITGVGLTLVWDMPGLATTTGGSAVVPASATSTATGTTPAATATTSIPEPAATTAATSTAPTETTATSTSENPVLMPLTLFFNTAFADTTDTASTVSTSSGSNTPMPEPSSTPTSPPPPAATTTEATTTATTTTAATTTVTTSPATTTTTTTPASAPAITILPSAESSTATTTAATTTAATTAAATAASTTPGATTTTAAAPPQPPAPDTDFLRVSYSLDGESWTELAKVGPANWQGFTANIPVTSWDDLKKLQVKIEGIPTSLAQIPKVYLDGMIVEARYEVPPPLPIPLGGAPTPAAAPAGGAAGSPVIVLPPAVQPTPVNQSGNFNANQAPTFDFDLNSLQTATSGPMTSSTPVLVPVPVPPPAPTSSPPAATTPTSTSSAAPLSPLSFFFRDIGRGITALRDAAWRALGSLGRRFAALVAYAQSANGQDGGQPSLPTQSNPIVAEIFGPNGELTDLQPTTLVTGGNLRVMLPTPGRAFMPGKYILKLFIWQNGTIYETQNDFSWGVLAVDFDKSIYTQGDTVHAGFAVLDDAGNTICGAPVSMDVTSPSGAVTHFSTADGTIKKNATCGHNNVTEAPDYSATLPADAVGTYQVSVSATTAAGARTITDHFDVQNPPLFDVTRSAPVRIYPPATYPVTFTVGANADYTGVVAESVPSSFMVAADGARQSLQGDTRTISWLTHLRKGGSATFAYSFQAPPESPQLYKLGPLQIGSWQEARQWQIAADVACGFGSDGGNGICVGVVTSTASSSWTVPSDWNNSSNTIEVIGGGGGGGTGSGTSAAGGGGGGAYDKITNFSTSTGISIKIGVGAGGGAGTAGKATYFNWNGTSSTSTCSMTTMQLCAAPGGAGSTSGGGTGGATANSTGTTPAAGGGGSASLSCGGGACGGGGGGAAGCGATSCISTSPGGAGGTATGSQTGGNGDNSFGGAGGPADTVGSPGAEWGSYGAGGGGGGGSYGSGQSTGNPGQSGGLYGAGGGGGGASARKAAGAGGNGTRGIIVISYTPFVATVTLGNGVEPAPTTIGPGANATTSDVFTFGLDSGTTTITGVTTTLSTILGVYQVQITNNSGTTIYGSSTNPGFPATFVSLSGLTVTTTTTNFRVLVKTFPGTFVPGDPPGSDFTVTSTVTAWTDSKSLKQAGSNTTSSIITVDNSAPAEVTNASGTAGNAQVALSWTNPGTSDFESTIVLRATSTLAGTEQWATSTFSSSITAGNPLVAYNDYLYVVGGLVASVSTSTVSYAPIYSSGTVGTWQTTNQLPVPIDNEAAVAYNGYIYSIGGDSSGTVTSTVYYAPIYSSGTVGTWQTTNALPTNTVYDSYAVAKNGYIYAYANNGGNNMYYTPINLDGTVGTWQTTNAPPSQILSTSMTEYNGYLYLVGGQIGATITSTVSYAPIYSSGTVGTWQTTNQLPVPIDNEAAVAYDGYLYAAGGASGANTSTVTYAPIYSSGTVGTWQTTNQLPSAQSGYYLVADNGHLYYGPIGNTLQALSYAPLPPRPVHGTTYATSTTITNGSTTATVACVVASSSNSCVDTSVTNGTTYYYDIYTADVYDNYSVGVVPNGNPFNPSSTLVSCSVSTTTTAFGILSPSAVATSSPNVSSSITCSDAAGCTLQVSDAGSGASPGLYKSSAPAYLIPSVTATLVAGTEGYGIQAATTSAGSGQALILNSLYNKTGNAVGALSTSSVPVIVASSTGTFTGREVIVAHLAAVSGTTLAGSYADIITYSCLGN